MTTDATSALRAQFEAWAGPQGLRLHIRDFKGSPRAGQYGSDDTQLAWEAWQKGATLTADAADGVRVPRRLTAANGAKAALAGEFHETIEVRCPECDEDFDCEVCDSTSIVMQDVPVSWNTIKAIYAAAIDLFTATPPTGGEHE